MADARTHWTENALGVHADYSANPLWGHLAEDEHGDLLLPAWWWVQRRHAECDGWWGRGLNLRNPLHWVPYLRSRLAGRICSVEDV